MCGREQMMKFLNPVLERSMARSVSNTTHIKLHNNLNLKRPNEILESHLKSNPSKTIVQFRELLRESTSTIDSYSLLYVTKACITKVSVIEGKPVHGVRVKMGYERIIFLLTSLLNMYSVGGNLPDAHRVFEEMPTRNVVSWTALISAYAGNQKTKKALDLFRQMQLENVEPDQITLTVVLSVCADIGALGMGEWIHGCIRGKRELAADLCLKNALINMYAKCGDVEKAKDLFDKVKKKDVTTWTSMILGYAINGQPKAALRLFEALKDENKSVTNKMSSRKGVIFPNHVTFIGDLMACSHAGMLEEGKRYFRIMMSMMTLFGLKARLSHYGCMVDLFCRCGMLQDACEFILAMPLEPNAVIWRTLLSACSIQGNLELAAVAYQKLLQLEESHVGDDVVMSNICAAKGMWDEKWMLRDETKQRRTPGHSTIEMESRIHQFTSADVAHPLASEIYIALEHLDGSMRTYCNNFPSLRP